MSLVHIADGKNIAVAACIPGITGPLSAATNQGDAGRALGLGRPGALVAASAARAASCWMAHNGNPVAAAATVHFARKERRVMWNEWS